MEFDGDALKEAFPTWFWAVGVVLVVGVTTALVVWYVQHPDRSPWTDFAQRVTIPDDISSLVGDAPDPGSETPPG